MDPSGRDRQAKPLSLVHHRFHHSFLLSDLRLKGVMRGGGRRASSWKRRRAAGRPSPPLPPGNRPGVLLVQPAAPADFEDAGASPIPVLRITGLADRIADPLAAYV